MFLKKYEGNSKRRSCLEGNHKKALLVRSKAEPLKVKYQGDYWEFFYITNRTLSDSTNLGKSTVNRSGYQFYLFQIRLFRIFDQKQFSWINIFLWKKAFKIRALSSILGINSLLEPKICPWNLTLVRWFIWRQYRFLHL